jgi:uncharacterized protein YchJ
MRNLKFYGLFLALTIAFSFNSCSTSSTSSPGDTVVKLYDLMKSNKTAKVAALYVSDKGEKFSEAEAKKIEGLAAMASEEWNKKDGLKNIEITEESIEEDGNSAKVKFITNFNNGDSKNEKAKLIKIDGKWFVKIS